MSERPTPETDAGNDTQFELAAWELLEEAQRERDEAREERDIARLEFEEISNDLTDARKERDELRGALMKIEEICVDTFDEPSADLMNILKIAQAELKNYDRTGV